MKYASKEVVEGLRERYVKDCRVKLLSMNDPYTSLPIGLEGTVLMVDDTGTIHVKWDNGSSLGVLYKVDSVKIIE
jgi:hypothetical protein